MENLFIWVFIVPQVVVVILWGLYAWIFADYTEEQPDKPLVEANEAASEYFQGLGQRIKGEPGILFSTFLCGMVALVVILCAIDGFNFFLK